MPTFRKGYVEDAGATRKGGGGRFAPELRWKKDKEEKYVLFLTSMDDVVRVQVHEWINVGEAEKRNGDTYTRYESFISRKDPNIGEDYDDLEDRLDQMPRDRHMGVAVELEPIMETYRGRQRPKGFTVKTETYTSKEGEKEQPVIGVVTQANKNFWAWLKSYDSGHNPINEVPMSVTREGQDKDTIYTFVPFDSQTVDLDPLFQNLSGINYLGDQIEDVEKQIADADDDIDAARAVGNALLDKRLEELADKQRYDDLVGPLNQIKSRFPRNERKPAPARRERSEPEEVSGDRRAAFAKLRETVEAGGD